MLGIFMFDTWDGGLGAPPFQVLNMKIHFPSLLGREAGVMDLHVGEGGWNSEGHVVEHLGGRLG